MAASENTAGVRPGDVLAGKYRVERIIGEGGMGVVVAAQHLQLDERVALKFLLPHALTDEAIARFEREARAAVKIKSEHVARVSDVGKLESGAPYIVMEYLEGQDLHSWVSERGPMPLEQASEFVLQACEAIAEAHALGIVHRDLKPSNLFAVRRADGLLSVKVLDFGISKMIDARSNLQMTRTSSIVGSPLYMSPEQMQSARNVDARTDIWSLGVILYELVTGSLPFDADTITELAIKVVGSPPRHSVRELRPEVPIAFDQLVMRCLEKDRDVRYSNVAELAFALAPFGPPRSRGSAERIQRTLQNSSRQPSLPDSGGVSLPDSSVPSSKAIPASAAVAGSGLPRSTQSSWGGKSDSHGIASGRALLLFAAGALLVGFASAVFLFRKPPAPRSGASQPSAASLPAAIGPSALPSTAPAPVEPSASAGQAPSSAPPISTPGVAAPSAGRPAASAPPSAQLPGTKPAQATGSPPTATPSSAAAKRCNPPYFLDAEGHRQYKPECL